MNDVGAKIREFLSRYARNHQLADDEDMFASKVINSMAALDLVLFIETTFGIQLEPTDLHLDNFRTIAAITAMVNRKAPAAAL